MKTNRRYRQENHSVGLKRRINRRFIGIALLAIVLTLCMSSVVYFRYIRNLEISNLRNQMEILLQSGKLDHGIQAEELNKLYGMETRNLRLTIIKQDGTVLYDSEADSAKLENHLTRPEIWQAISSGSGSDARRSNTVGAISFYYAKRMSNGNIVRIATEIGYLWNILVILMPSMFIIFVVIWLICLFLGYGMTNRILRPIRTLASDLDDAEKIETYEEIQPLIEKISTQHQQLKKSARMRQEFTANVSHELKTPLTSISGYAELIETGLASGKDIKRFSREICKNSERMQGLITDILHLSELDSSDGEIEKTPLDLKKLAEDTRDLLQMTAEQYQVDVIVDGKPQIVACNRRMMDELVYNLCDNAIRYNEPGGKVWIHTGETDGRAYLAVQDTGIGIREEEQDRIFERFYRVDKSRSRQTGGTGLGLAIVKHIAALHRAEILIDSKLGVGTTIEIRFPSQKEGRKS